MLIAFKNSHTPNTQTPRMHSYSRPYTPYAKLGFVSSFGIILHFGGWAYAQDSMADRERDDICKSQIKIALAANIFLKICSNKKSTKWVPTCELVNKTNTKQQNEFEGILICSCILLSPKCDCYLHTSITR